MVRPEREDFFLMVVGQELDLGTENITFRQIVSHSKKNIDIMSICSLFWSPHHARQLVQEVRNRQREVRLLP